MNAKLTLIGTMAVACAAFQLTAMPTEEETRRAEPVVQKLLASERAALESGKKTRSEVAVAAMKLADEINTDAVKMLLMKGAFVLYVQDGNHEKAIETLDALKKAIPDMPSETVVSIIESSSPNVTYKFAYEIEDGFAVVAGVDPKPVGTLVVPDKIDGYSVTRIGRDAFRNCKGLTSVKIPEDVTHIDVHAFDLCDGLKSVTLPSSLEVIGYAAFGKCSGLKSVAVPNGVKSISADAFNGCGLKSVVIPSSVTSIGDRAFCECGELESVEIPAEAVNLGKGVFAGCNALKRINVDSGNQVYASIDGVLYTKDRSVLAMWPNPPESAVLPAGVTNIMGWAFAISGRLASVTIPESVTSIGAVAFLRCVGLKSMTIPASVKNIGEHAFHGCGELASVTMLGERPELEKDNIFDGCDNLQSIHVPANAKSWSGMKEWMGIPLVFDAK